MCMLEIFTDVYPNNVKHRYQRLLTCDDQPDRRVCDRIVAHEHSPRLLPYAEAPPALMAPPSEDGRTVGTVRTVRPPSRTSSTSKAPRKYWRKGEQVVVDIDLPWFGKKGRRRAGDEYDDADDGRVVEIVEPAATERYGAAPVPPPAPMPPAPGRSLSRRGEARHDHRRHGSRHETGRVRRPLSWNRDDDVVEVPPPPYRDRRRRSPTEDPVIIQVAPPGTAAAEPARRPSPAVAEAGRSSTTEAEPSAGDEILRRQVDRARRESRQAERERRQAAEEQRRQANVRAERSLQSREQERQQERVQQRNIEVERANQARERESQARRRRLPQPSPPHTEPSPEEFARQRAATAEALLRGQRVARSVYRPVTVQDAAEDEDSGEDSWNSAPGEVRIIQQRSCGQGLREHGERVLDAAGRRWALAQERRQREDEERRRADERALASDAGTSRRRRQRGERVVWGDEQRF